jgi:hypothetical protein
MKAVPIKQKSGRITLGIKSDTILSDFYRLGNGGATYKTWFQIN